MSQKNETAVLVLALLITLGLIGGVYWWLARSQGLNLSPLTNNKSQPKSPSNLASGGDNFNSVQNIPSGLFSYGGSSTWAPIRKEADAQIKKALPQFQLRYTNPTTGSPGSGTGIKMLLKNQLAFSQSSRPVKNKEYQQAQQRGFTLQEIPVAIDGIAIAINPNLDIPGLTLAQIKDIFTGKITNWQEVGGENLPITPYSKISEGGTVDFFVNNVLQKENFGENIEEISTTTEGLRKVAQNKGGIYYASAPEVVGQCGIKPLPIGRNESKLVPPYKQPYIKPSDCPQKRNQINTEAFRSDEYPMTRRLFVVVKKNSQGNEQPSLDEKAGLAYANLLLTEQGQKLISQAGFVRIR